MADVAFSFSFTGGDAEQNQLNFYDAARFQYGAARFVYTLEHFRQTGRVLSRLNTKIKADFRVGPPKEGSFVQEVFCHFSATGSRSISETFYQRAHGLCLRWVCAS